MKNVKKLLAVLAAVCLTATAFSGCNFLQIIDAGADYIENNSAVLSNSSDTEESKAKKSFSSMDDYIKSPINQVALNTMLGAVVDDKSIEIKAEENKLLLEYTYNEIYNEQAIKSIASQLSASYKDNASAFVRLANSLEAEVDVENPCVVIRYYNGDGTLIYEKTFKSQS